MNGLVKVCEYAGSPSSPPMWPAAAGQVFYSPLSPTSQLSPSSIQPPGGVAGDQLGKALFSHGSPLERSSEQYNNIGR